MRNRKIRRECRFVFQLVNLISGIWGTYNGIYIRQQLDQLRRDLTKAEEHQDQLFAVTSTWHRHFSFTGLNHETDRQPF